MSEENLLKLVEAGQENQRWMMITTTLQTGVSLITALTLAWTAFKRVKPSPKVRLIRLRRKKAAIDLEIAAAEQEAVHEAELVKVGAGLGAGLNKLKEEVKEEISSQTNFLKDLKEKGAEMLNKKTGEIKGELNKLKDKFTK